MHVLTYMRAPNIRRKLTFDLQKHILNSDLFRVVLTRFGVAFSSKKFTMQSHIMMIFGIS